MLDTAPNLASAALYCRQARRLRARFHASPPLLHRALSHLSRQHDGEPCRPTARSTVKRVDAPNQSHLPRLHANAISSDATIAAVERAFTAHVWDRLRGQGSILRYSDRLSLLKAAERLQINRFRANLIIAMVQHESVPPAMVEAHVEHTPAISFWQSAPQIFAAAAMMEITLIAAMWWMCR